MLVTGEELSDKLLVSSNRSRAHHGVGDSWDDVVLDRRRWLSFSSCISQGLRLPHGNSASWGSDEGHPGNPSTQLPRVSPDLKLVGISP